MSDKTWAQLVRSGKALAVRTARTQRSMSEIQWAWGDLAQEVEEFAHGSRGGQAVHGVELPPHPLAVWAEEVGCPYSLGSLRNFRRTARAWPVEKREPTACILVHQILHKHQDLIRSEMTQREANDAIGYRRPIKVYKVSTDRLAAQLMKPEVIGILFEKHPEVKQMLEQELLRNLSLRQRILIAA